MSDHLHRFGQAITEAANRAEATALLIRCGFRVYRPEADLEGEDLVVRSPQGELRGVQLKGRAVVDWKRYGGHKLWMLFPSAPYVEGERRDWFLVPHDDLFAWVEKRHGHAPKWDRHWSYPAISKDLGTFLGPHRLSKTEPDAITAEDLPPVDDPEAVFTFAMTFNGYERLGSFEASATAAQSRRRETLEDIRNELFMSARASRHGGDDEYLTTYRELLPLFHRLLAETGGGEGGSARGKAERPESDR